MSVCAHFCVCIMLKGDGIRVSPLQIYAGIFIECVSVRAFYLHMECAFVPCRFTRALSLCVSAFYISEG